MEALSGALRDMLAACAGVDAALLDPDRTFVSQGIGASELTQFRRRIEQRYGCSPPNLLWGLDTLGAVSRWIELESEPSGPAIARQLGFVPGLPDPAYYE